MRTRPAATLALVLGAGLAAACGSEDAPTIEPGAVDATTTSVVATSSTATTVVATTTSAVESVDLVLTGDQEVPGPGSSGRAEATLTYDGDRLCVAGTTSGVGAVTAGHVHAGRAGESGPVVVDLGIETTGDGPFEGCATVGAEGGIVVVDPASYYVNLHTAEFPDGAVRGQVG